MSFSFNGLKAQVTITGGQALPQPTSSQTPVIANVSAASDSAVIYTVPANKILYVIAMQVNGSAAGFVGVKNDGTIVFDSYIGIGGQAYTSCLFAVTAGKALTLYSTIGATNAQATISGYIVDV